MRRFARITQLVCEYVVELGWDNLFLYNRSRLAARMRQRRYRTRCFIDAAVVITCPERFEAQANSALYHGTYILNRTGRVSLGHDSHLGAMCYINALLGQVTIGDHVAIGPQTCIFSYSNSYSAGELVTSRRITNDVSIGNNVFVGAACRILPGVVIGDNVVVGAGAVVASDLESNGIYGGVPCRRIKDFPRA
jgi:galactoside O-acetyltransferase